MSIAQACFLQILDNIGLPHEDVKQSHGEKLEIIGFKVDLPKMAIWIPPESKEKLISNIWEFIFHPPAPHQQLT